MREAYFLKSFSEEKRRRRGRRRRRRRRDSLPHLRRCGGARVRVAPGSKAWSSPTYEALSKRPRRPTMRDQPKQVEAQPNGPEPPVGLECAHAPPPAVSRQSLMRKGLMLPTSIDGGINHPGLPPVTLLPTLLNAMRAFSMAVTPMGMLLQICPSCFAPFYP